MLGVNRLYAVLDEMEADGLIKGHAEREGLRPTRTVYHPTSKGIRLFERWLHDPSRSMRDMRVDFPPKLYFACRRGPQDVAESVQGQRAACHEELARISERKAAIAPEDRYKQLVYDLRVGQIGSILDWLDSCERELIALPYAARQQRLSRRKTA